MTFSYTFMPGDPICVDAAAGRLTEMYTTLNGHWMYNILRMLETLATGYKTISLNSSSNLQQQYAAIDRAPIATDRMRVAVTAVALAGQVTSLRFQKDYESALAMVPNQQRQEILQFLADRAPAHSKDIPVQMDLDLFAHRTAWSINTSSGVSASVAWFTGSHGKIYLHHGGDEGEDYTYSFTGIGTGKSISAASITYSHKSFWGGGVGRLYRSGSRLADLTPRSFEGMGAIVSVSGQVSPKLGFGGGVGVSLLMLAMVDSFNAYSDINQVPRSAGAVGFLWGTCLGLNTSKGDIGISWQAITVTLDND